jgi:uncharacterized damage-inducible protein DinB
MTQPALTAVEVLQWNDLTAQRWRALLAAHPEALDLPCDIYRDSQNVRGLLRHIVAVELRQAQRLAGEPETPYEEMPDSAELLFAQHDAAVEKYRRLLADDTAPWNEKMEFTTRSAGKFTSSRRKMLFHALLHSIRHYAQLATLVRQHGMKPDWPMDLIFLQTME